MLRCKQATDVEPQCAAGCFLANNQSVGATQASSFAGYELPVQYAGAGVLKEHMHCRAPGKASVFDVGHMGQIKWTGADRAAFLEKCVVGDIKGLGAGEGRLS